MGSLYEAILFFSPYILRNVCERGTAFFFVSCHLRHNLWLAVARDGRRVRAGPASFGASGREHCCSFKSQRGTKELTSHPDLNSYSECCLLARTKSQLCRLKDSMSSRFCLKGEQVKGQGLWNNVEALALNFTRQRSGSSR